MLCPRNAFRSLCTWSFFVSVNYILILQWKWQAYCCDGIPFDFPLVRFYKRRHLTQNAIYVFHFSRNHTTSPYLQSYSTSPTRIVKRRFHDLRIIINLRLAFLCMFCPLKVAQVIKLKPVYWFKDFFAPWSTTCNLNYIYSSSSYGAVYTLHLTYKNQSLNALWGKTCCFSSHPHTTNQYTA